MRGANYCGPDYRQLSRPLTRVIYLVQGEAKGQGKRDG